MLLGNGDGTFQSVTPYAGTGTDTARVEVADFDRDHNADVVALNYQTGDIAVFLGRGDGTLQSPIGFGVGAAPNSVVTGPLNADGRPDMAIVNQITRDVSVLVNERRRDRH